MLHRHLNHQQLTHAAIDDLIARGKRQDWVDLRRAALADRAVVEALRQRGIGVNVHDQAMGFAEGDYPEAERYYREAISLPLYPGLAEAEQDFVVEQ